MKKYIILGFVLSTIQVFSQVIIGNSVGTATDKTSVLLEFANTDDKGIIIPYVTNIPTTVSEGTILMDASNAATARLKFYNGTSWVDLSGQDGNVASVLSVQTSSEDPASKVIIGAQSSNADGVLVLESSTKAMVLPTVTNVNNIPSPSPGMMVYVKGSGATPNKRLAIYNGSKWSFWRGK